MLVDVFALPDRLPPQSDYDCAVAIDVLRATTVIAAALSSGVARVVPFCDVQETLDAKRAFLSAHPEQEEYLLLGGERQGVRIDGFDLGNSPADYTPETVKGKTLYFSTTNGTRAILCGAGRSMITASFLNASAVVRFLADLDDGSKIALVCAGTNRAQTTEDLLLAGYLARSLDDQRKHNAQGEPIAGNVLAETAQQMWREVLQSFFDHRMNAPVNLHTKGFCVHLERVLRDSPGGRNLTAIGLDADIADACRIDTLQVVPTLENGSLILNSNCK